ncbi:hypothetical protein [Vitiosangium sp. GDMCC 1.1324]|uniref:hypothetical protein n=1 Tax=Vitiosangium sp. (strain GDMCC 1.1324) TaxID=2138576 RepID=UPI000D395A9C|nr:hypothetical protein [Vitiosangium sp. GDMCC 1.1324]PTL84052.1 hypothetical protein DAT35_11410 [Vitiosangium sp. GDMCC 1.1324]
MTRFVRLLALAVLLPAVCACSSLSSSRRSQNVVSLRFAWPEHFSARVSYSYESKGPLGGNDVARRYLLTVEPGAEKGVHRLVPRDIEVFPPDYAAIIDPVPTVRFDDKGSFLGADIPELPGQQLLEALPLEPEKRAELVKNMVVKEEQSAKDFWIRLVGHWRGAALIPGEPIRLESKMVVGRGKLEMTEVPSEELYTLEAGIPCSRDEQERRCVRLSVEAATIGQSKAGSGPMASWRFDLVTDPDTLVPYSYRMMRKDREDGGEDGGTQPLEESMQVEEYVFTYPH